MMILTVPRVAPPAIVKSKPRRKLHKPLPYELIPDSQKRLVLSFNYPLIKKAGTKLTKREQLHFDDLKQALHLLGLL